KEAMKLPPKSDEFRSKPAWQRLIIMLGGVFVNIVLAIVIFIGIMYVWGEKYVPIENLRYGLYADSLGRNIGLQDGDRIYAVAGKPIERVGTVGPEIIMSQAKEISIERNGQRQNVAIPQGFIETLNRNKLGGFTYVRFPLIVDTVTKKVKVIRGSLQKGDSLISFNDTAVKYSTDIQNLSVPKDKNVQLKFLRNGKDTISAEVYFTKDGESFIGYKPMDEVLGSKHITYTFAQAIPAGWNKCWETLSRYIQNLKLLFTSKEVKVKDSLGSVVSIANTFGSVWDWQGFWTLTAIFSIILAFMNVLPIPGLDGGHALFCIFEIITGRKPSDKFMEYAQTAGMILLLGLMAYALGLDFWRIFK
ncbi:MAG: site-2 protease family protein, partial [Chitinophagaceae bacterium]|nr:site-2 protease family protein [Chitinophagaceae bacterium]